MEFLNFDQIFEPVATSANNSGTIGGTCLKEGLLKN